MEVIILNSTSGNKVYCNKCRTDFEIKLKEDEKNNIKRQFFICDNCKEEYDVYFRGKLDNQMTKESIKQAKEVYYDS